jgi:hypothetical protein
MKGLAMTEQDIINAFLAGTKAETPPFRSDGERLYVDEDVIAEWGAGRLNIEPRRQGGASERGKDLLVHSILLRMSLNREVRRLLHGGCREQLSAALRTVRPGGRTSAGNAMPSRVEPLS